jgi:hypothetical protein
MKKTMYAGVCAAGALLLLAACDLPNTMPRPNVAGFHAVDGYYRAGAGTEQALWREGLSPFEADPEPAFQREAARVAGIASGPEASVAVAVGEDGKGEIAYSPDGMVWTRLAGRFDIAFSALTYGEGYFFAGGADGKAAFSQDGKNWQFGVIGPMSPKDIYGVAAGAIYGTSVFVVAGRDGRICYSLGGPQGVWYAATLTPFGQVDGYGELIHSVCFGTVKGSGVFVAVGQGGKYAFANDLSGRWYGGRTGSSKDFLGIAFGNDKFLAVGDSGVVKFISEPDKYHWTEADSSSFHNYPLFGVTFDPHAKLFAVFGDNSAVGFSRFGDVWQTASFKEDHRFPNGISAMASTGKRLVAGGVGGEIAYSN